ncbi:MAG: ATP-binding cassette domain-containing protein [Spirochaetaceae bacterium]
MKGANKLVLKNISVYREENVFALQNFSFDLKEGEIHALYGEHFCGKSSVVNILTGACKKYKGKILLDGNVVEFLRPKDSLNQNISVIYQYSNLILDFNSYENVYSGRFITNIFKTLKRAEMLKNLKQLMSEFNVDFNLNIPVKKLSPFNRNFIEIAKALIHNPDVLILDEVSSRFKTEELKILHTLLGKLKNKGKSIIYIFSNINEDFDFADRITILKDGRRQGTEDIKNVDKSKLVELSYAKLLTAGNDWDSFLEKRYSKSIIDELKEGIIVFNNQKRVSVINRSAIDILDMDNSGENFLERLQEGFVIDKNSKELILSSLTKNFHLSLSSVELINGKFMDIVIFPLANDNEADDSIIMLEDVTEKCHMQEYKIGADKVFSLAELAAGVVHEINNPLAIISNYTELLKMKITDINSQEKIQKIEKELSRIEEITGSLLSFSKMQSGKTTIDLKEILLETLVLLEYKIKTKDISLNLNIDDNQEYLVNGNSSKLKQVIINLVINSIEAVLDEGIIDVEIKKKNNSVILSVEDNGSGVNLDKKSKIFDPFFTTKVTKKNTGLGLAISKQIVEDHRGEIGFKEIEDKTIFYVSIPEALDV